jgi:hypothetical protein
MTMLRLAGTLHWTRRPQTPIDPKTGRIRLLTRTYRRRMSQPLYPMTGDKQNPATVPGFSLLFDLDQPDSTLGAP